MRTTRRTSDPLTQHLRGIFELVYAQFDAAERISFDKIIHYLSTIDPSSAEASVTADSIYQILVSEYNIKLSSKDFKNLIFDQTTKLYKAYVESDGSLARVDFNLPDARAMKFLDDGANVYLGQFVTGDELKTRVVAFVKENYFEQGQAIGNNKKVIDKFISEFRGELEVSRWKVREVVDTTASRARTFGQINGMRSAAVKTYEIVGPLDGKTCGFCEDMVGRTFTASVAISRLDDIVQAGPASLSASAPFLKGSMGLTEVQDSTDEELEGAGFGPPPYHPSCRHSMVVNTFYADGEVVPYTVE